MTNNDEKIKVSFQISSHETLVRRAAGQFLALATSFAMDEFHIFCLPILAFKYQSNPDFIVKSSQIVIR